MESHEEYLEHQSEKDGHDQAKRQVEIDDARSFLNSEGYVVIKWQPGDTWEIGEVRDICEHGLAIQLSNDEARAAASQILSIWCRADETE